MSAYPDHLVFAQVALSQLIAVQSGVFNSEIIRSQYKQLVADFVLCRTDYSIVAVIELDDSSHLLPDRQYADRRKTIAVQSAGLRLLRIPAGPMPDIARLRQLLDCGPRAEFAFVRSAVSSVAYRITAGLLIAVVAALCIWGLISQRPELSRNAAAMPNVSNQPKPAIKRPPEVHPPTSNRVKTQPSVVADKEDALALQERKKTAWEEYYIPPASCENSPTGSERIACGNRYLSARRQFEAQWKSQYGSSE